jgi:CubicO group peptidase (beta-lactamase class C family)
MRSRRLMWVLLAIWITASVAQASELSWPDTDLSRRVQGWFAQLKANDADAKAFLKNNFADSTLAGQPMATRMERRRAMIDHFKGMTPVEIAEASETQMKVKAHCGNGMDAVVTFAAQDAPPHLLTSISIVVGHTDAPPTSAPATAPFSDEAAAGEIRKILDDAAAKGTFSGAVLLARGDHTLLRAAWGLADRDKKTPITPDTRFNIASLGKLLTRVAVAQLCQNGTIALDDHLDKYLPDFPHAKEITIDMLAQHRSGVGDIFNDKFRSMDHSKLRSNHDYLQLLRGQPLEFAPGTQQRYSNGGYVLLGEVIAHAANQNYYAYLIQHVYEPSGMTSTSSPIEGDDTPNVARGYTHDGAPEGQERDNVFTRPWRGSAAGGSYSTVDDLFAFDRALLGGRLCTGNWIPWVWGGKGTKDEAVNFALGGGAPGISATWEHAGDVVWITLANDDPSVIRGALEAVRAVLARMSR